MTMKNYAKIEEELTIFNSKSTNFGPSTQKSQTFAL